MRLIVVMLAALCANPALAQNWIGLLKNTPAERFDEEDLRLFLDMGRKALNEAPEKSLSMRDRMAQQPLTTVSRLRNT